MFAQSGSGDTRGLYHEAMLKLSQAWGLPSRAPDMEHWEVANAQLTVAVAATPPVVRDEKRQWGFPVHSPDSCLPWLSSPSARRPRWVNAS